MTPEQGAALLEALHHGRPLPVWFEILRSKQQIAILRNVASQALREAAAIAGGLRSSGLTAADVDALGHTPHAQAPKWAKAFRALEAVKRYLP